MEPQIQYCTTSDGVSIAYVRAGSGVPFVRSPNIWSNIGLYSRYLEAPTPGRDTIILDSRGTGASQRDIHQVSLETRLLDLEAVVDHLRLDRFVLYGAAHGGPSAIAYQARHPARVSHLILSNSYAQGTAYYQRAPIMRALASIEPMATDEWTFYTHTAARFVLANATPEAVEGLANAFRDAVSPEVLVLYREESRRIDVSNLLGEITCPTLIQHEKSSPFSVEELSRQLASKIPGARLMTVERIDDAVRAAVDEFIGVPAAPEASRTTTAYAFRTILFTDIEANTELLQRVGDERWRALLREHEAITRAQLSGHGGTEVKHTGDGFMASFGSAAKALECAIALQQAFAKRDAASEHALRVRIGVNAGEPIAEEHPGGQSDLFGTAVTMAARIMGQAQGGEVLVSDLVRQLVAGKGFLFADRGETVLRGFEEPVRLWQLRLAHDENPM